MVIPLEMVASSGWIRIVGIRIVTQRLGKEYGDYRAVSQSALCEAP